VDRERGLQIDGDRVTSAIYLYLTLDTQRRFVNHS
jgi:hypothetical protein